jgi:uncharacterized repeat protein (TIGR03803 family)
MRVKALVLFVVTLAFAASARAASTETVVYNFDNYTGDGLYPYSGLVADKAGNLYGTTYQGGATGLGSVFELKLSGGVWTETLLYSLFLCLGRDGRRVSGIFPTRLRQGRESVRHNRIWRLEQLQLQHGV